MTHTTVRTRISLAACALIATASALIAGPLNPPPGPVSGTYKTLSEIEPRVAINSSNTPGDSESLYTIRAPGSYYLTGNVTGVEHKHGITIAASGVRLDLSGFDLAGIADGDFDGVHVTQSNLTGITVINGSVHDWPGGGVNAGNFSSASATDCRIERVRSSANRGNGIAVGESCTVTDCSAVGNQGAGILASSGSTVAGCAAAHNGAAGIFSATGCTIASCSASSTTGGPGISTAAGCSITNCSASFNNDDGIITGGSTVIGCTAFSNTHGNGIYADDASVVSNCSSSANSFSGIFAGRGSIVTDCSCRQNSGDGISCLSVCIIRANSCSGNGEAAGLGAGIHAFESDNRIENNTCTGADVGLDIEAAGNFIIRNTCSGNGINWTIASGNALAPIVAASTNPAAVNGNTYSGTLGSTDANANFTY